MSKNLWDCLGSSNGVEKDWIEVLHIAKQLPTTSSLTQKQPQENQPNQTKQQHQPNKNPSDLASQPNVTSSDRQKDLTFYAIGSPSVESYGWSVSRTAFQVKKSKEETKREGQ